MPPAVSVVMPAFDAAATIGGAVTGVLWQQNVELELVVVDDGSSDETAAIAGAFADPRVRLIRQDNAGCAAARNRGIAECRAELITLCDADDILLPGHVNALLETHERQGGIATANAWYLETDGQITRRRVHHRSRIPVSEDQRLAIIQENFVSVMSLFHRELVERVGGFDESLLLSEDWDFWIRAIYEGSRVSQQPRPLALYNRLGTGKSADRARMDAAARTLLEKVADRDDLRPEERDYLDRRLADQSPASHGLRAQDDLAAGRWSDAAAAYQEAARLSPHNRPLRWRATAMRLAPRLAGPLLRRRS